MNETQQLQQFEQWDERKTERGEMKATRSSGVKKKERKQLVQQTSSQKKAFIAGSITAVVVFIGGGIAAWTAVMSFINSL